MKRNLIGALLFLALVGEIGVGAANGLFTPPGAVVLILLYIVYFRLFDAIVVTYQLSNLGIVLVNFALYSVLVTGLLHGEIADYVLHPQNNLITTLIRIQCSFFPLFAYYFLRKFPPGRQPSIPKALAFFAGYVVVMTATKTFGLSKLADTLRVAPAAAWLLIILAIVAFMVGVRQKSTGVTPTSKAFRFWCWALLVLSFFPGLPFFLVLMSVMIGVSLVFLGQKNFRGSSVAPRP